ncbi:MAG TPA: hypothetical protein VGF00_11155, partial [Acidimicrobiia bacterium]
HADIERRHAAAVELELVVRRAEAATAARRRQPVAALTAAPARPVAPAVFDYEVASILPAGAEVGWVYQDAAGTSVVVVASPRGRRLARLADMCLLGPTDLVPPLNVTGGIEVSVHPLETDDMHVTIREGAHA